MPMPRVAVAAVATAGVPRFVVAVLDSWDTKPVQSIDGKVSIAAVKDRHFAFGQA